MPATPITAPQIPGFKLEGSFIDLIGCAPVSAPLVTTRVPHSRDHHCCCVMTIRGTTYARADRLGARAGRSASVKGFRMPASHCARGCTEAGVRKASKEETAGVGLWGFKARFCTTWPLSDGTAGLNG